MRTNKTTILYVSLLLLALAAGLYAALPGAAAGLSHTVSSFYPLIAGGSGETPPTPVPPGPPNIILILSDDQHWSTVPFMPVVSAELAGKGTTYSNAFVPTSACCPSRASIFTGQYTYRHGVLTGHLPLGGATLFDDSDTIATRLHDAGYATALFGKYLNDYDTLVAQQGPYVPPGWDRWFAFVQSITGTGNSFYYGYQVNDDGALVDYGTAPEDYSTDVLAAKAIDFINTTSPPYYLELSTWAPHGQAVPADRHEGMFAGVDLYRPPNFNMRMSDPPSRLADRGVLSDADIAEFDLQREDQLETLQAVDEAVAGILTALEESHQLENTLVLFMTDNGLQWGELGLRGKTQPYESASRVPFIIRWPGQTTPATEEAMVLNIDLAPTFLELAGNPYAPGEVDGMSLVNLAGQEPRQEFLLERWKGQDPNRQYVCVRTTTWKYCTSEIFLEDQELYDLANDPYELANVAHDPAYLQVLGEMQALLAGLLPAGTLP